MDFLMIHPYDDALEDRMMMFYNSLSEKDKRRYAAIEVLKLPYGGRSYIHNILNCSYPTIDTGIAELKSDKISDSAVVRVSGGGRKSSIECITGIDDLFLKVLKDFTAGDPMDQKIKWTHLTYSEIIEAMSLEGIDISKPIVKKLFKRHNYVKRKAFKNIKLGATENRNEQFENIAEKKKTYEKAGNPVISVDTKKKN
jgi:hypothetical protein